jgi:predicted component of type VI protein secretion system
MGDRVTELTQAVQQKARELLIRLSTSNDAEQFEAVKKLLEQSPGDCEVFVEVPAENMTVRVRAHPSLKIQGSVEIESALRALGCEVIWQGFGAPARAAAATTAN